MRTTLDIDDDILRASKEIARREHSTAGKVISELARRALGRPDGVRENEPPSYLGFQPFPRRGRVVTNADIDALREDGE